VTVAITVSLTSYAFVPAIFTDVTPIALISPLTIVVRDLAGQSISLSAFGFSTLPPLLTATLFFGLGAGLYREEDMFTQRSIPLKVLDALAGRIARPRSVGLLVAVLIPFVLVAELVVVALLFAVPEFASIPLVLAAIVVIEEVAKGVPSYAGFVHRRYDRSLRSSILVGTMAGLGFFVAEKGLLLVQFLFQDLPAVEEAALATSGPVGNMGPLVGLLLLFAPLALHVVTATATAIGGSRGRRGFAVGLAAAILIHFAYNLTVVITFV
jgi:RsiW-degrading membrane proteinase PrsW (M82 family)